ncbi:XF1762 family protein [Kibdelosporangium phytohabitans]|uniref:XF1762 family protein n=1 Tax=Kibdelosporangium phytohabitans TaxID=860235 RepID=UPI002FFD1D34
MATPWKSRGPARDGTRNANSALYGAAWRVCRAMGAHRMITYTQDGESGASLRAAGLHLVGHRAPHAGWDRPSRKRTDAHPTHIGRTLWLIGTPFGDQPQDRPDVHGQQEARKARHCRVCSRPIDQRVTGRPRTTCSDACRARATRQRRRRSAT